MSSEHSGKTKRRTDSTDPGESPDDLAEWFQHEKGADDYRIIDADGDEVEYELIWEVDDRIDEATLPDGVDPAEVAFDDRHPEVLAHVGGRRSFDPRNGRWYKNDPRGAPVDDTTIGAGIGVECAYADCNGYTDIELIDEIDRRCGQCNSPNMGRGQFTRGHRQRRQSRRSASETIGRLSNDLSKEMKRLTDGGCTTVAAMDYLMCSVGEIPYEEWAEARGVGERAVKRNIKRVANSLGETVTYKTRG